MPERAGTVDSIQGWHGFPAARPMSGTSSMQQDETAPG
jgi:hypothetical protein